MVTRIEYEALLKKVDHMSKEMEDVRRLLLESKPRDEKEADEIWNNLMKLSEEISAKWQGPSAVKEIRAQRSKGY